MQNKKVKTSGLVVISPYLKTPYQIFRSKEFKELSPEASKIYCELLSQWSPVDPYKGVPLEFNYMKTLCSCGSTKITEAIGQLIKSDFVSVTKEWHRTTRFFIQTWWFTDKYIK